MKNVHTYIEKYTFIFLFLIVIIGGFFRFYHLSEVPPSLNWDEVAFGYNAYSILQTGKDEYGTFLPLYLRSLDDYKRPVYTYATVASVGIFGLNDFAVRFPAALFGTLTIILIYFLTLELTKKKAIALLAGFFLAITPWHIQFSHAGFEATLGFFFTGLGVLFSLWGMRKNLWWLPLASVSFGLALYSYLGQRVAVPLLILTLFMLYFPKLTALVRSKKRRDLLPIGMAAIVLGIFCFSLANDSLKPEGNIRYKATSIFAHSNDYDTAFQRMQDDAKQNINIPRRLFHDNRKFTSLELVMRGYLTHFSPDFFFFDLGQQHHQAPGVGLLYIWMLPFMLIGIYHVVRHEGREEKFILGAWILGPPVAAAVTYQIPHALRVGDMIIPIIVIIAVGTYVFFSWLKSVKKILVLPVAGILVLIGAVYVFYFFHQYHIHLPLERSRDWVYGRKEAVSFAELHKQQYESVIVSTTLEYPHIFFLYYTKYDPAHYQADGGTKSGGFAEYGNKFDKYKFHPFDYESDSKKGKLLFIGKPEDFPPGITPLKAISYLNGQPAIFIVESREQ